MDKTNHQSRVYCLWIRPRWRSPYSAGLPVLKAGAGGRGLSFSLGDNPGIPRPEQDAGHGGACLGSWHLGGLCRRTVVSLRLTWAI